ncbi:MAG: anti-sigma-factor antagonist [Glaciihabitans sp.]|nr:anti-sigma-factor antagonist [Glaciihabitans sp.]
MEFSIVDRDGDIAVLRLNGRLNMVSAGRVRDAVATAVADGRSRVVVDLTRVEFMDSSGLGALVSGMKAARLAGGDLRIASPTEQVKLVLQLTNMDRVLPAYDDAETAFANA